MRVYVGLCFMCDCVVDIVELRVCMYVVLCIVFVFVALRCCRVVCCVCVCFCIALLGFECVDVVVILSSVLLRFSMCVVL